VGASAMQRTPMIPGEMVFIVEALVLLFVLLSDVFRRR
jgi:general nucleoside transport system permease protein